MTLYERVHFGDSGEGWGEGCANIGTQTASPDSISYHAQVYKWFNTYSLYPSLWVFSSLILLACSVTLGFKTKRLSHLQVQLTHWVACWTHWLSMWCIWAIITHHCELMSFSSSWCPEAGIYFTVISVCLTFSLFWWCTAMLGRTFLIECLKNLKKMWFKWKS